MYRFWSTYNHKVIPLPLLWWLPHSCFSECVVSCLIEQVPYLYFKFFEKKYLKLHFYKHHLHSYYLDKEADWLHAILYSTGLIYFTIFLIIVMYCVFLLQISCTISYLFLIIQSLPCCDDDYYLMMHSLCIVEIGRY